MLEVAYQRSAEGCVLLLDGIERLNWLQRRQLYKRTRNAAGLVITRHQQGKLPVWIGTQTSPELIQQILDELELSQPEIISAAQIAFAKNNGNIRNALRELYDQFAAGGFNKILS